MLAVPPAQSAMVSIRALRAGAAVVSMTSASSAGRAKNGSRIGRWFVVIDKDADGGAIEIIILASLQRPEEEGQPAQAKQQCAGDEDGDAVHFELPRSRSALATTMIEEPDMASAAMSGVTMPAMASGTAMTL